MKKFLMIFGAIALAGVIALAGFIGWAAYRGSALDKESKAFIDSAIPAIAAKWDRQQLIDRAAPELLAKTPPGQLAIVFDSLARLGPMVDYEGAKGDSQMSYGTDSGSEITAKYKATARFRDGSATFQIVLVKRGRWAILGFHVEPVPAASATKRI